MKKITLLTIALTSVLFTSCGLDDILNNVSVSMPQEYDMDVNFTNTDSGNYVELDNTYDLNENADLKDKLDKIESIEIKSITVTLSNYQGTEINAFGASIIAFDNTNTQYAIGEHVVVYANDIKNGPNGTYTYTITNKDQLTKLANQLLNTRKISIRGAYAWANYSDSTDNTTKFHSHMKLDMTAKLKS